MALQGTIKDFGVGDIFQLIGMQRKSGVLTLESNEDTVTVSFIDGQVAGADTRLRNLEDLLGSVLVRTGRITQDQLQQALTIQKKTLQRLGYILVHERFISEEELSEALRIQVTQIVYRLFRWRSGRYHFQPKEDVEYDREHFVPIGSESILMEGARMIDEWPIIERRIKSDKMIFKKTEAGLAADKPVESIVEEGVDFDFGFDGGGPRGDQQPGEGEIKLSADEREILRMVDGRSTVAEIVDLSAIGEFDTYRVLYELLTRNLIVEIKALPVVGPGKSREAPERLVGGLLPLVLGAFSLLSVATLSANPLAPWRLGEQAQVTDRLRSYASRVRLEHIERAIRVFYLDTGSVPDQLELLADHGYLTAEDLVDPWGRDYGYQLGGGSFRLLGRDPEGNASEDLTISRRFSASQRLVMDGAPRQP